MSENKNVVLIMGKPNSGKSTSLRNLHQERLVYINADNKEVPFKHKFMKVVPVVDPNDVVDYIEAIENEDNCDGAVLDTLTFMMSEYERQFVAPKAGTKQGQAAWGNYGNFYRKVIHAIKTGKKDYAVMAHQDDQLNEQSMMMESKVPVKGGVGKTGVEADFTTILCSMQVPLKMLEGRENKLLNITPEEKEDGVKYVFLTRITKEFTGYKVRSPMGLWQRDELFIDNDVQLVFNRLKAFYGK